MILLHRPITAIGKRQLISTETETKADVASNQSSMHGRESKTQRSVQNLISDGKHNCSELTSRSRQPMCKHTTLSCPARSKKGVEVCSKRPLTDMKKPAAQISRTAPINRFSTATATQPGRRRPSRRSRQWTPLEARHRTSNRRFREEAAVNSTWTELAQPTRQTRTTTRKTYKPAGSRIRRSQRHQAPRREAIPPMRQVHQLTSLIVRAAQPLSTHMESQQDHRHQRGRHSSEMTPTSLVSQMSQHRQEGRHHPQHADRSQQLDQSKPVSDATARSPTLRRSSRNLKKKHVGQSITVAGMGKPSIGTQNEAEADADMGDIDLSRQPVDKQCVNSMHRKQSHQATSNPESCKDRGEAVVLRQIADPNASLNVADSGAHQHRPGATIDGASKLNFAAYIISCSTQFTRPESSHTPESPQETSNSASRQVPKQRQHPEKCAAVSTECPSHGPGTVDHQPEAGTAVHSTTYPAAVKGVDVESCDHSVHRDHIKRAPECLTWMHGAYVGLLGFCRSGQKRSRAKATRSSRRGRQPHGSDSAAIRAGGSHHQNLLHLCIGIRQASHKLMETYSPNNQISVQNKQDGPGRKRCRLKLRYTNMIKMHTKRIACLCTLWIAVLAPLGAQVAPDQIAAVNSKFVQALALAAVSVCCPLNTASHVQTGNTQQQQSKQKNRQSEQVRHAGQRNLETHRKVQYEERRQTTEIHNKGSRSRPPAAPAQKPQSQPGPKSGAGVLRLILMTSTLPGSCGVRVPGASTTPGRPSPQLHINQYFVGKQVEGATVQNASRAATGSHCAEAYKPARNHVKPRRGGIQPRFRIFTLNVGGLSAFMWSDLKAFLRGPGLQYDTILLQETHRTQSSEFCTAGWNAIGSASTSKADGLMTLINPKHATQNIKHDEVVPGRLQRVQVVVERGRVEILNAYQHVWNYNDSTEANIGRRQKLLDKITQTVNSIARRHTVILAGDLNAELVKTHPHTGNALAHTNRHIGPGSAEPLALTRMIEEAQLIALNTFHASPPHTYFGTNGASQIDYIMTRSESTDYEAKQVKIFEPLIGGWKELGHRALSTSIRIAQHFHLHPKKPTPHPFDKAALDEAVAKDTAQARQLRQRVQEALASTQEARNPDYINQVLLQVTQAVFPKHRQQPEPPNQRFLHLWEHRQSLRKARPVGQGGFFLFWKSWSLYNKRTRELRQSNTQQKREYTNNQLQEAERHHRSGNQGGLYRVVRALAPWKPRQRIQLRSEKGQLLDHKAEHSELVEHCQKLYNIEETEPTALTTAWRIPDDLTLLEKHFAGIKAGKAVPPDAAPSSTWRCCAGVVASWMHTFIQQQVNEGEGFTAGWTNATLALLPKPQKPANRPGNLRAIGLIRPDGKAIAAAIKTKVAQQSAEWLRWVPQFSYQPSRDIADCITRVQQALQQAEKSINATRLNRFEKRSRVEEGTYDPKLAPALKGCIIFSADLSKAFDMVNRQKLGRALALAGVESSLITAVLELHKNAKYDVSSGPYRSTIKTTRGIRQGCTLAPTLWTVLSAQLLHDLADKIGEAAFTTFTAFADDQVGHWNIQSPADIEMVEEFITTFLQLLEEYGLQINPEKSKLLFRLQGSNAKSVIKKHTDKINNQKCWKFVGSCKTYHVPIVDELTYLGIVISVRRSSATLTLQHRLAEADKRTSCLRRSIRSRRIIPVHTRLSI